MPKIISKEPHPVRSVGFLVKLDNGKRFSVIDLASGVVGHPSFPKMTEEHIALFYDDLGRYEAMRITEGDKFHVMGPDEACRAHTMEELLTFLESED